MTTCTMVAPRQADFATRAAGECFVVYTRWRVLSSISFLLGKGSLVILKGGGCLADYLRSMYHDLQRCKL